MEKRKVESRDHMEAYARWCIRKRVDIWDVIYKSYRTVPGFPEDTCSVPYYEADLEQSIDLLCHSLPDDASLDCVKSAVNDMYLEFRVKNAIDIIDSEGNRVLYNPTVYSEVYGKQKGI